MAAVSERVADKQMLKLIRAFLEAGVMENGLVSAVDEGTPQGGPLSPLLSNLVLDELDRELEQRGHRFVRYADDCNIYVRSERAGLRVMESITDFITLRLKLKVNQAKSAVAQPWQRKFLGFSFTSDPKPKRRIAPKAIERFKARIRELTRRTRGISLEQMVKEITTYLRGWLAYFGDCQTPTRLRTLESWLRRRLRSVAWKQWKTGRKRFRELRKRGVQTNDAAQTAASPHGPWRISSAPAPGRCLAQCLLRQARPPAHGRAVLALIRRTAVCGSACTVVWQGRRGDPLPYADCFPQYRKAHPRLGVSRRHGATQHANRFHNRSGDVMAGTKCHIFRNGFLTILER